MSDYFKVREAAKSKGLLPTGGTNPIPITPSKEYSLTRNIVLPVIGADGKKVHGRYMHQPAIITVIAFTAGEASARADEIQANARTQAWGNSMKPWESSDRVNWIKVEVPADAKQLELR